MKTTYTDGMSVKHYLKAHAYTLFKEAMLVCVLCVASLLVAVFVSGVLDRGWRTPIQRSIFLRRRVSTKVCDWGPVVL